MGDGMLLAQGCNRQQQQEEEEEEGELTHFGIIAERPMADVFLRFQPPLLRSTQPNDRIDRDSLRTISKKTKYGLQSLIALARRYGEGPVLIATLAKVEEIPIKFLELILLELKNNGLLESKKGPRGGYFLRWRAIGQGQFSRQ